MSNPMSNIWQDAWFDKPRFDLGKNYLSLESLVREKINFQTFKSKIISSHTWYFWSDTIVQYFIKLFYKWKMLRRRCHTPFLLLSIYWSFLALIYACFHKPKLCLRLGLPDEIEIQQIAFPWNLIQLNNGSWSCLHTAARDVSRFII